MVQLADLFLVGLLVVGVGTAAVAWRNRDRPGSRWLAGIMIAVAVWAFAHGAEHYASAGAELAAEKAMVSALLPIGFLWVGFVLAYTDRGPARSGPVNVVLLGWPVAVVLLLWLPAEAPLAMWPQFDAEAGSVYWLHVALSYGLLALGAGLLISHLATVRGLFRRQGLALLAGLVAVGAGSAVSIFEVFGGAHLHGLPVGLGILGVAVTWGVVDTGLTRVAPMARQTIIQTLDAGVIALADNDRITTVNPAARQLLGVETGEPVVGRPLTTVVDGPPEFLDWCTGEGHESPGRQSTTIQRGDRVLRCERSRLETRAGRQVGAVVLLSDVTAERTRREELKRQNDRLEEFAGIVSHDLRNPLTVAMGHLELAREERESDHLATAADSLQRMETLIEDLLALARQGQSIGETEPVPLDATVAHAWSVVAAPDAALTVDADVTVAADPDRLQQLFENLFRNAVEHAGSDVSLTVAALPDGFAVADDGPGIPAADRDAVFEPGYSTADAGTGLGLAIVAEIVDAHGWSIAVTESDTGGARFAVTGVTVTD